MGANMLHKSHMKSTKTCSSDFRRSDSGVARSIVHWMYLYHWDTHAVHWTLDHHPNDQSRRTVNGQRGNQCLPKQLDCVDVVSSEKRTLFIDSLSRIVSMW